MKICSIIGARPQFIKAAPLSGALRKKFRETIIHTGQHYDQRLSAIFFEEMGIPEPDYNLGVGSSSHGKQTALMMVGIEEVLIKEEPDMVLIYGDTNSTVAGALTAVKLHYPIGHVEAGLRSFNRGMPEEINRILADRISDLLFCPTSTAIENLKNEGITEGSYLTGDVMYDALLHFREQASSRTGILDEYDLTPGTFHLLTVHRAENTDDLRNLRSILSALSRLAERIVFPVHPRTRKVIGENNIRISKNISLIDPVSYLDMICLEQNADKILTDSGGVQKEAYLCGKPCITLRNETEWVETVEDDWNILVGTDPDKIVDAVGNFNPARSRTDVFGYGRAAEKIAAVIEEYFSH